MAQHDYLIDNQSGAGFRADLNAVLQAIQSNNSGSAEPSPHTEYQWWVNETNGLLTIRNSADSAWTTVGNPNDAFLGLAPFAYYRLNAAFAGTNVNTAQSLFGVGISLEANTVYEFEMLFALSKSAGTASHTIGLGFAGTAGITNIAYQLNGLHTTASFPSATAPDVFNFVQTASNTAQTLSLAFAAVNFRAKVEGTVSTNATAGTLIPQYTLSAAPGGAYSTQLGSFVKLRKIGASGANINVGGWA